MAVRVAEYLGQRPDSAVPVVPHNVEDKCPFTQSKCIKISRQRGANEPVCSIYSSKGLYVVCTNRIFPTSKLNFRTEHRGLLMQIAERVFPGISQDQFAFKTKTTLTVNRREHDDQGDDKVELDYVLRYMNAPAGVRDRIILEVQGGGESGNTGILSEHVRTWRLDPKRTNTRLMEQIGGVGTLENNAWKRQLEQMVRKGKLASVFNGGFALACGTLAYNYMSKFLFLGVNDPLEEPNWGIALIEMADNFGSGQPSISFHPNRMIYLTWDNFIECLRHFKINCDANPFEGKFLDIRNDNVFL